MTIKEIISIKGQRPDDSIAALKQKAISIPSWDGTEGLEREYYTKYHPVMDKAKYPDVTHKDGTLELVTRIPQNLQEVATHRLTELCFGIPATYDITTEGEGQERAAKIFQNILKRNRIDSVNIERGNFLFASCEVMTLWYAVPEKNNLYGEPSNVKYRCMHFSPMQGDAIYPLYDEEGDLVALSLEYTRKKGGENITYFDCYTADRHIQWMSKGSGWKEEIDEAHEVGKIPAVYMWRPTPAWGCNSPIVYEIEWALSRNGNYLRKNSKPVFAVFANEGIDFGKEGDEKSEFRSILQFPEGGSAQYITWNQAVENLKYYVAELRSSFFSQLQIPDWSYENMKSTPMSGEARKQLFIDAQLKVTEESGRLVEFLDREANVIKALMKKEWPELANDIEAMQVNITINPYMISDERDTIDLLMSANGGKPLMSHRESIAAYGHSSDVERTLQDIAEDEQRSVFEGAL